MSAYTPQVGHRARRITAAVLLGAAASTVTALPLPANAASLPRVGSCRTDPSAESTLGTGSYRLDRDGHPTFLLAGRPGATDVQITVWRTTRNARDWKVGSYRPVPGSPRTYLPNLDPQALTVGGTAPQAVVHHHRRFRPDWVCTMRLARA